MPDDVETLAPATDNPASEQTATQTDTAQTDAGAIAADTKTTDTTAATDDKTVTPDWPEDWRDKLAKGDDKERKILERFRSPQDLMKSFRALQAKMSSGDVKEKLADNATPEQVAAYRKDNGIPEKPEGYLEKLPNGLVIGEDDKPLVASFLESAHELNADPAFVGKALDWYYRQQEQVIADRAQSDKEYKAKSDDELRAEWGTEYRGNINSIMAFLDTAPTTEDGKPLKDLLLGGRLADGTAIGNNPAMLRWLAQQAHEANPAGFVSPGTGGGQIQSLQTELDGINKVMRENRAAYNKDEKMQARWRTLTDAIDKLSSK